MPKVYYREQADQALNETLAYYGANPLPASHKFAFNPKNQQYLNGAKPGRKNSVKNNILTLVVAVGFVVTALYYTFISLDLEFTLARDGVAAQATIVDKHSTNESGSRTRNDYYFTYELAYRNADGNPKTSRKTEEVSSVTYNTQKVGGVVKVIYSPGNPAKMKLADSNRGIESILLALLIAGPICLIVAIVSFAQVTRHVGKRLKLKRGQMLTGFVSSREVNQNRAGKLTSVKVDYRFVSPAGQHLTGQATFPARFFKSRWHIVEEQKPLVVLYRNDRNYEVL